MPVFHIFLALIAVVIWGFNFVVIKTGLQDISPLLLGFSRFFLTSIPAVFFIKRPAAPFKWIALYGLVLFALQFSLLFMGMHAGMPPGLTSLVLQSQLFFSMLLAALFFNEKITPWQITGALIAFSGIAFVGMNIGAHTTVTGFLLVISAAAAWGAGNAISKKIGKVNTVSLVVWGSLVAWPFLFAVSLVVDGPEKIFNTFWNLTWLSGGAVLYITYLATLVAFGIWNWLLHRHPMGNVAPFTLLVPIFAMLSSILVLDEPLHSWKIVAAVLVISGVCIHLLGAKVFRLLTKKYQIEPA